MNKRELKRKGKKLIVEGYGLIDTSNRTRDVNRKSALALASKKLKFSVLMFSQDKKKLCLEKETLLIG